MKRKFFGLTLVLVLLLSGCGSTSSDGKVETTGDAGEVKNTGETEDAGEPQWKPNSTITIYCVSAAGGATDLFDRTIAHELEKSLGVSVQVVNATGGSGGVAASEVWNKTHDGTSILGFAEPVFCQRVLDVFDKSPSDWILMPGMNTADVISVSANSNYKTIEELVEAAKSGSVNMASAAAGSVHSIQATLFEAAADVSFNRLNYEGSVPSQTAAMNGEVECVVTGLAEQIEYIRSGQLVPLAMLDVESAQVDDILIPAITDTYPAYADMSRPVQCIGIALPNDTDQVVVDTIYAAYEAAMQSEGMQTMLQEQSFNSLYMSLEDAQKLATEQERVYSWALYDAGVAAISPEEFDIAKP